MGKVIDLAIVALVIWLAFNSYLMGVKHSKKEQQKTIESEVCKRCLDSDIYNDFQCYNMIIKGE